MTTDDPFVDYGAEAESELATHDRGIRTAEQALEKLREDREEWMRKPITNEEFVRFAFMVRDSLRRQSIERVEVSRYGAEIVFVGGRRLAIPDKPSDGEPVEEPSDWRERTPTYGVLVEMLRWLDAPEAMIGKLAARAEGIPEKEDGE